MTTTPEATKGVPRIVGDPAPTLRADHNALADYVRDNLDSAVANPGALPASGNWVGRRRYVTSDQSVRFWNGSAYVFPAVPIVRLRHTATLTSGGAFAFTTIPWNTEDEDTYAMHDGTNPSRLTCVRAGVYLLTASYLGSTNAIWGIQARLNGTELQGTRRWVAAAGGGLGSPSLSKQIRLAAGDYLEIGIASGTAASSVEVTAAEVRPNVELVWQGA